MSVYKQHLTTNRNVVIIFDDRTVSIASEDPLYKIARRLLDRHEFGKLEKELNLSAKIEVLKHFQIKNGCAYINGKKLPEALSNRLIEFVRNDEKIDDKHKTKKAKDSKPQKAERVTSSGKTKMDTKSMKFIAVVGSRNRVKISSIPLAMAGIKPGVPVVCHASVKDRQIIISQSLSTRDRGEYVFIGQYTVCEDGSVKLGPNMLKYAKLDRFSKFSVTVEGKTVKLTKPSR